MAKKEIIKSNGPGGAVFFFAWIGALVYFLQQTNTFWGDVLAVLKSLIWPAYLVYEGLKALGA
ncbi:MAG TPA: hypothetical protein VIF43_03395 [Patescibacteria group bacterium]|jgi:hypothetical protein